MVEHFAHVPYIWLELQGQAGRQAGRRVGGQAVIVNQAAFKSGGARLQQGGGRTGSTHLAEAVEQVECCGGAAGVAAHPWLHVIHTAGAEGRVLDT